MYKKFFPVLRPVLWRIIPNGVCYNSSIISRRYKVLAWHSENRFVTRVLRYPVKFLKLVCRYTCLTVSRVTFTNESLTAHEDNYHPRMHRWVRIPSVSCTFAVSFYCLSLPFFFLRITIITASTAIKGVLLHIVTVYNNSVVSVTT